MSTAAVIKTRFCPSPTGLMHLGNLRTALFNRLLSEAESAKSEAGRFLLRIEDTDLARSEERFTEQLMVDLRWLGLNWDEGPEAEGEHAPYFQSKRTQQYQQYYDHLLANGDAYYCFCSEQTLSVTRKLQLAAGQPPRYPGTCRHLTVDQIKEKQEAGLIPTIRFRVPDDMQIRFEDLIQGPKVFSANDIGDFIIQKEDGTATFMFCNAVDDAVMGVTHALRGEDHLTNTPRQIMILQALNLPIPQYGHMPLIVGHDGKPLSKRNGSMSVEALREAGYWPVAILNYLSRLGHHYPEERLMPFSELGSAFSVERIGRSPACFDLHQLHHWQKEAILKTTPDVLWEWMKPQVESLVPHDKQAMFVETVHENILFPEEAKAWANDLFGELHLTEENQTILQDAGKEYFEVAAKAAAEESADANYVISQVKAATGKKGKALFMPFRVALSGRQAGPELHKLFAILGQMNVVERFRQAGNLC